MQTAGTYGPFPNQTWAEITPRPVKRRIDRREAVNAAVGRNPGLISNPVEIHGLKAAMTDEDKITAADIARERSIARIFGNYDAYVKSLPASVWTKGERGWVGRAR